jgi:hypothetical protein
MGPGLKRTNGRDPSSPSVATGWLGNSWKQEADRARGEVKSAQGGQGPGRGRGEAKEQP